LEAAAIYKVSALARVAAKKQSMINNILRIFHFDIYN